MHWGIESERLPDLRIILRSAWKSTTICIHRLRTTTDVMQVLDIDKWHEVSAFQWLTGWPQENLLDPLHGPSLTVSSSQITLFWVNCFSQQQLLALHAAQMPLCA